MASSSRCRLCIITVQDVLEAIVGDFPSIDKRMEPTAQRREDGSWLVDAGIDAERFEKLVPAFHLDPTDSRDYETFGGFVLKHLQAIPKECDAPWNGEDSGYFASVFRTGISAILSMR